MTHRTHRQFESLSQAAERIGLSTRTLRRRIAAGELTAYRNGPRRPADRGPDRPFRSGWFNLYASITSATYRRPWVGLRATTADSDSRCQHQRAASGSMQLRSAIARSRSAFRSRRWIGS